MEELAGQVALVTGAGAGLGRAIALEMARAGATVATVDIHEDAAGETAALIAGEGGTATPYVTDVAVREEVDATWDAAARDLGRLDIVVNNAGVSFVGPTILDTTDEAWHKSIDVMQHGVFYGMRAAARHMLPQRSGSVVTISSIRGFSSNPGRIAYCAAKAAALMMTRVAAAEWAPFGVRANAIAPGVQRTPMWEQDAARGAVDEPAILRVLPAGRLGDPAEVGRLAVFLSSRDAAYINGSCVTIDGALTAVPAG
ncbi:SDR family oxidoreductase [Acidimicrobiaceae bacterium USS-CC1]|uniref:SDR family oxidoreductase n=1 Tax=Acidiferrimicrobium australe TaxID=2664430 RepID=A0ABW9QPP3_9ACTN|nr:SDR family oxidoreductase [Acidiferrimicrobium australe]